MYIFANLFTFGLCDSLYGGVCIFGELELLMSYHPILFEQGLGLLKSELHVEHILLAIGCGVLESLEGKYLLALCRYVDVVYATIGYGLALFEESPCEVVVGEVSEEIFVAHLNLSLLKVLGCGPNLLIVVAHLISMGVVATVGSDDTITIEVVVRSGVAAIVTAIGEDLLTLLVGVAEALIYEVPDETTLQSGVFADEVPILLQATNRVTHGVGILALDEGFVWILSIALHIVVIGIHGATDVAIAGVASLLILCGAATVISFNPIIGSLEVGAITGLITQAPEDD